MSLKLIAETLGLKSICGAAKLIICDRTNDAVRKAGLNKYQINGVVLCDDLFKQIDGEYGMIECEILIVPKRIHKGPQGSISGGMTGDQLLTCGYEKEENWKKHLNF